MNKKEMDIWLYQEANENRLLTMTGQAQLAELCLLRQDRREAVEAHDKAQAALKESDVYADERRTKEAVAEADVAIEATLRLIEASQVTLPAIIEQVNTVTGEIEPSTQSTAFMQQRVFGEHDAAAKGNGQTIKPTFVQWEQEQRLAAIGNRAGQGEVVVR